jgi:hypothetical protein
VETGVFAWRHWRGRPEPTANPRARSLSRWSAGFFAASAAASLAGAAAHGLSASKDDPDRLIWWRASLCSVGLASWTLWHLSAAVASGDGAVRAVPIPVNAVHLAYVVVVARTRPPFWLALALYAPGALVLRWAFLSRLRVDGERGPAAVALLGLTLSTAAGVMQVRKIAIHPRLFDHNATFHVVQAVAFALIDRGASDMVSSARPLRIV